MVVSPGVISLQRQQGFKSGISRRDLVRQWGQPAKSDSSTLVWEIANTSDGIIAPSRFVVNLNNDKAANGYVFGVCTLEKVALEFETDQLKPGATPPSTTPDYPKQRSISTMAYQVFTSMTNKADQVMTYLLRLINGQEYILVAASPDEVMSMPENGDTWLGKLFNGKEIAIPDSQFLSIEPDRYRVITFNGQTSKVHTMSESKLERTLDKATDKNGEVQANIRAIEDTKDSGNRVSKRQHELP